MTIRVSADWWKTLFDRVYLATDARTVGDETLTRLEIDAFCELVPIRTGDRVLDLCGGHGRHSLELTCRGLGRCTVFDYSRDLLAVGKKLAARRGCAIDFIQGDARCMQFKDSTFDHVLILGNSLGYIPGTASDMRILSESFRLLKPGGWLLVDMADGRTVKETWQPQSWHEIERDVVVCRERQLDGNVISAREMVLSKANGLIRDRTYCMRLYEPGDITDKLAGVGFSRPLAHCGFRPQRAAGDYGFMNHRMIVTARR
jgi:D-alanine-D-alanine ligase